MMSEGPSGSMSSTAMLLTPPGAAAIAVIRLCGPNVQPFLLRHLSRTGKVNRCVHADLRDGQLILDDVMAVGGAGGASVDLGVHGGPWVVRSILDLAQRSGFDLIGQPAPLAAFDGEILQREILASLPHARTELAIRALLAQRDAWALART